MKYNFSKEFIDSVKEANDIIEIASEYFDLQPNNKLYKAKCIHDGDNDPSLIFFPDGQTYRCYGCDAGSNKNGHTGSDIIGFIQWIENLEWQEAVIHLAKRAGIEIPAYELTSKERELQKLYSLCLNNNRRYWMELQKNKGMIEWFYSRGMDDKDIANWRLGIDNGKPTYAIIDASGRTVAFSRRNEDTKPKYINDATNLIFKKGSILYGLHNVKKLIRQLNMVVVVEGYNDVILLQKYGVPAVATMGLAVTAQHEELIRKHTNNIVLFFDGDNHGKQATEEQVFNLTNNGFNVEVIIVSGRDPDELAIDYKENTLNYILTNKRLGIEYLINEVVYNISNDITRQLISAVTKINNITNIIKDEDLRLVYKNNALRKLFDIKL